jgi:hypothetical protein
MAGVAQAVEDAHERRGTVDDGRVDDLPAAGPLRLEQGAHHTEGQERTAPAHVAGDGQRRGGRLPIPPHRTE